MTTHQAPAELRAAVLHVETVTINGHRYTVADQDMIRLLAADHERLERENTALREQCFKILAAWEALCRCTDEFIPEFPGACDEYEQNLYGQVEGLKPLLAAARGREEGT